MPLPRGNKLLRSQIVEAKVGLHKIGVVSNGELGKMTIRMLGRDMPPKGEPMTPAEILVVREKTGLSQAALAAFKVSVNTVSQ